MAGISISSAHISIGGPHIASINTHAVVAIPRSGADIDPKDLDRLNEIAKAVSLPSSREILHALPISYVIDGQQGIKNPLGMAGTRLESETHIITASSVALSNLIKCMGKVEVDIEEIIFSGIASSESVLTDTEKKLGVVLVDIGSETTDIVIFVDGAIIYSSVIPIGARYITNDIAVGLKVSLESAELIKLKLEELSKKSAISDSDVGNKKSDNKSADIVDLKSLGISEETEKISIKSTRDTIIRSRLREIFELVEKEIKKSGYGPQIPFGIVISGGGALTIGTAEVAKYILGFPARVGSVEGFSGLSEEIDSPVFATASGLILYAVQQSTSSSSKKTFGLNMNLPGLIQSWFHKLLKLIK